MNPRQLASMVVCALAIGLAATPSHAQLYDFVNLADTTTPAPTGTFTSFSDQPSIGAGGGFVGSYPGGSGVFTRLRYGGIATIAQTGDAAPSGVFTSFGQTSTRDQTISFQAGFGAGQSGVFQQTGVTQKTLVKSGDAAPIGTFTSFGEPSMPKFATFGFSTSQNLTAFRGQYGAGAGIFMGDGGALTTLVKTGDAAPSGTFTDFGNPSISAVSSPMGSGVPGVAFRGSYDGVSSIFIAANGSVTQVASPLPTFFAYGDPYLLNNDLAVRVAAGSSVEAIYTSRNNWTSAVVTRGDPAPIGTFSSFGDPILTFLGVGFEATYGGSRTGIFGAPSFGFGGQSHPIIKTGDPLFGSNVVSVSLSPEGGASSFWGLGATGVGDFAFHYVLTDGRQGIALVVALPEPGTAALALLPALAALGARRRRS